MISVFLKYVGICFMSEDYILQCVYFCFRFSGSLGTGSSFIELLF